MSADITKPFAGYEHIASAGIWNVLPLDLSNVDVENTDEIDPAQLLKDFMGVLASMPPYPYLRLLQNEELATKDRPTYAFQAALTRVPEEPFIPVGDTDDDLAFQAEADLVAVYALEEIDAPSIVYDPEVEGQERPEDRIVQAVLPKSVKPIGFHPPLIEALGRFMREQGSKWTPDSLGEIAGISPDFYSFETQVPAEQIQLNLGGETHIVDASALVAAGLRMTVCETIRVSRYRPLVTAVQEDPKLLQQLIKRDQQWQAELAAQSWWPELPASPQDFPEKT